jgi:hypothetical protein
MMTNAEFAERSAKDFEFMAVCARKNNMAMYHAMRDFELEEERKRRAGVALAAAAGKE